MYFRIIQIYLQRWHCWSESVQLAQPDNLHRMLSGYWWREPLPGGKSLFTRYKMICYLQCKIVVHSMTLVCHIAMIIPGPAAMHHTPCLKVSCQSHAVPPVDYELRLVCRPGHRAHLTNLAHDTFGDTALELLYCPLPLHDLKGLHK